MLSAATTDLILPPQSPRLRGIFRDQKCLSVRVHHPSPVALYFHACISMQTCSLQTLATQKIKASLFLFSAYPQINNKANVVTSPKENIPTPALVYLASCTFLKFCTVCCCFSHLLSLNQYLCIICCQVGFLLLLSLFCFCFLFKNRRKVYVV